MKVNVTPVDVAGLCLVSGHSNSQLTLICPDCQLSDLCTPRNENISQFMRSTRNIHELFAKSTETKEINSATQHLVIKKQRLISNRETMEQ